MFCLASRVQTSPESVSEVVQIFQKQALPLVSKQPGFKGVYLMTKPAGDLMVLNIWDMEAQANAWPQNLEHQKIVAQLKPLFKGALTRDGYEVSAYKVA